MQTPKQTLWPTQYVWDTATGNNKKMRELGDGNRIVREAGQTSEKWWLLQWNYWQETGSWRKMDSKSWNSVSVRRESLSHTGTDYLNREPGKENKDENISKYILSVSKQKKLGEIFKLWGSMKFLRSKWW